MKLIIACIPLIMASAALAQTGPDRILDGPSIFSQNRTEFGGGAALPPRPPEPVGERATVPVFVGTIVHGGQIVGLIEYASGPASEFREVRTGDVIPGGYRVLTLNLRQLQVSDGMRTRVVEIGNNLLNEPRVLPAAIGVRASPAVGTGRVRGRLGRGPVNPDTRMP
jgi:hypothetical protein